MADATPETIQRLLANSEKGLALIDVSLPPILAARQAVIDDIKKLDGNNAVLDLMLAVFDSLLAENEVIYDLSASLDALLKATDDYTKRFYMQSLNLCFVEACRVFVGEEGDDNGVLSRLEKLTKQLNQAGCELIVRHIIDDIQAFRKDFCNRELRNITRHYDDPIKMYEKQQELTSIEFFAKGSSQLMAIRMEVSVVSAYLLNLFTPVKKENPNVVKNKGCGIDLKGILNDVLFKTLKEKSLKEEVQRTLNKGQATLDDCYGLYKQCVVTSKFLDERNCQIPAEFDKMKSLIQLRMEALFLRYDIACSVWGYLNATSDKERSQNLRLVHITKQAALTHIYGYTEKVRETSLWTAIKKIEESGIEKLNTESVEKKLAELTGNLDEDKENSQLFAHYRYKQDFYIPARLDAFNKMEHHKELMDAMKLLKICKVLEDYTTGLLFCIHDTHKNKQKRQYDEWKGGIDGLIAKTGNDEGVKEALKPLRDLVDVVYGDEE